MDRKDFLKRLGLFGLGASIPAIGIKAKDILDEPSNQELLDNAACSQIPEETAGPYPAPSSISTSTLVRQDITEGTQTGIPLTLNLTIINQQNNCQVVEGLRVDIWHCNIRGYYSAYAGQPGIDGTTSTLGQTWLRGIQYTNTNGEVTFTTIYPGWYTPRATHIHVQVFDSSNTLLCTTQLAFPETINTTVNNYYNTSGRNSFTNTTDMVFSDSYSEELMTVTGDTTSGYVASKTVTINAVVSSVEEQHESIQTGGQFSQLNNYPNPCKTITNICFNLVQDSEVNIQIFDIKGALISTTQQGTFGKGNIAIPLDVSILGSGAYIYKLQVSNQNGTFAQSKTLIKE